MSRLEAFRATKEHAWHGKSFSKLSLSEIRSCEAFILTNEGLSLAEFELAANRWFLDQPKPKHWTMMWQFVVQANTQAFRSEAS